MPENDVTDRELVTADEEIEELIDSVAGQLSDTQKATLRDRENVIGVATGLKREGGERTNQISVVVYVRDKQPAGLLDDEDVIPETINIGESRMVTTDVVETGEVRALDGVGNPSSTRDDEVRPIVGGVQISSTSDTNFGTCTAKMFYGGREVVLTNRHVAEREGDHDAVLGQTMQQPHSGSSIGTVIEASAIQGGTMQNTTDIAIVELENPDAAIGHYLGYQDADGTGQSRYDRRLITFSTVDGLISGHLLDRNAELTISFNWGTYDFEGVHVYERHSRGGGSGSAVGQIDPRTGQLELVGILFASGDNQSYMIPWEEIEDEFGEVVPAQTGSEPPEDIEATDPTPGDDATVTIQVRDENDDPIEGALVDVSLIGEGDATVTIEVMDEDANAIPNATVDVTLIDDAEGNDAEVTIRALDSDGDPIEGATVGVDQ